MKNTNRMKSSHVVSTLFLLVAGMILMSFVATAIPDSISIQGQLRDTDGAILTGSQDFTFRIYDAYTGGTKLFEQNNTLTLNDEGVYHAELKDFSLPFNETYYVGIKVNADPEMSPRINLTSAPYSIRSNVSDKVAWADIISRPFSTLADLSDTFWNKTANIVSAYNITASHLFADNWRDADQSIVLAGENITSGTIPEARIPSSIARDSELDGYNTSAQMRDAVTQYNLTDADITGLGYIKSDTDTYNTSAQINAAVTIEKDIVATSPVIVNGGTNVDDVIIGSDADITFAISEVASVGWRGLVSDPTGTGSWVFSQNPILVSPTIGWATAEQITTGNGFTEIHLMDQNVRTNSSVVFSSVNTTDWTNVTITESQISDLVHSYNTSADIQAAITQYNISDSDITGLGYIKSDTDTYNTTVQMQAAITQYNLTDANVAAFGYKKTDYYLTDADVGAFGYIKTGEVGASVDDTDMTAEDFGEFTCTGGEDGCTLDSGTFDDEYVELGDNFAGDVSGPYSATEVADDSHDHVYSNIDAFTEANLYSIISDVTEFVETGDTPKLAGSNMTGKNVTDVDCIIFSSGGKIC
ncbi:hypothetical protein D1BOALGB6SA_10349 [Olavius sp. associated proteobacterium Delta 1]|nr:hypothetical protein D1BOALGB6SA_10349 [Olavius sp. associated proteobacterium Delta 1]